MVRIRNVAWYAFAALLLLTPEVASAQCGPQGCGVSNRTVVHATTPYNVNAVFRTPVLRRAVTVDRVTFFDRVRANRNARAVARSMR
jgi:hypothetical protein